MEQNNSTRSELFRSMLINEKDMEKEVLNKARKVFLLDTRGNLHFEIAKELLTDKQLIGIYLLAGLIASELEEIEAVDSPVTSADDLTGRSGIDQKSVRARLSDLKKQQIVDSPERGLYQITIPGAMTLLDEILENNKGD